MQNGLLVAPAMLACLVMADGWALAHPRGPEGTIPHNSSAQSGHRLRFGDWTLAWERDRFTSDVTCRIDARDDRISFGGSALGFHFGRGADVLRAAFRVDEGPVLRWRDELPELARLRVAISGRDMTSPTDGIVWIPADRLRDAAFVTIQPHPRAKPRTFRLRGLDAMLAQATERGCLSHPRDHWVAAR